jgi:Tol biopolymer transport system component
MYEIVNVDPQPLSAIRDDIDPELDRLILDCLQKDPNERCQSAREISRDLRRFKVDSGRKRQSRVSTVRPSLPAGQAPAPSGTALVGRRRIGRFKWFGVTALAAAAVTASAFLLFWRGNANLPSTHVLRLTISAPQGTNLSPEGGGKIALSPDGQRLVMVAVDSNGASHLWLRPLSAFTADRLPGTDGASYPFWAPDSRQVGFFADGKLKRIDVTGGSPLTLCDASDGRGGTWNREGAIVFAPNWLGGLSRVGASGGIPIGLTNADSLQMTHRWPQFLPDGNRFLYFVRTGIVSFDSGASLWVGSADGSVNSELMRSVSNVYYAKGYIFFLRENTLMAQPFDAGRAEPSGDPFPVAEGVFFTADYGNADFSVAENGTLAYQTGQGVDGRLIWFDRNGRAIDTVGDPGWYWNCRLSPDGRFLAVDQAADVSASNSDVWVYDLNRDVRTRLTFGPGVDDYPVWSPNGRHVYFSSGRGARKRDLYCKPSSGAGEEQLLLTSGQDKYLTDCASDGRHLVFLSVEAKGATDLWTVALAEGGVKAAPDPVPFLQTEFTEGDARFSPDGRWLAYRSDETGYGQIYVRPFPGPGGKWQISTEAADYPCWRRDGRELFYLTGNSMLMAVDVNSIGSSFAVGRPRPLFQLPPSPGSAASPYDVTVDGQRFIVITRDVGQTSTINVIVNWDAELRTK